VRIGVFGGTFDPPHIGHLLLASDAREALRLDRLIFVPAATQPFKAHSPPIGSPEERLEMVSLSIASERNYAVDNTEIGRSGLSFTVDTLEQLSKRNSGAELFLLLGEDALAGVDKWKNPERIRELATLAVMRRSGPGGSPVAPISAGAIAVSTRRVDVSSTEIRERLRAGKSIKGFVPESVEKFIEARGLYR
jgi:nicotinate-nucleotide adenylyltransferase